MASAGMLAAFIMGRERGIGPCDLAVASVETDPSEEHDGAEVVAEVGRVARSFGLPFFAVRPAMHRRSVRVEAELVALAREQGFDRVALAVTRDDEVRAVLRGLSAAEGLRAVAGYSSRGVGGVIRPMLPLRNAEAAALARDLGIEPVQLAPADDGSRDELERAVLTRWRAREPGLDRSLARIAEEVRALRGMVDALAEQWVGGSLVSEGVHEFVVRRDAPPAAPLATAVSERLLRGANRGVDVRGSISRLARLLRDPAHGRGRGTVAPTLVLPGLRAEVRLTEQGAVVRVVTSPRRGAVRASG